MSFIHILNLIKLKLKLSFASQLSAQSLVSQPEHCKPLVHGCGDTSPVYQRISGTQQHIPTPRNKTKKQNKNNNKPPQKNLPRHGQMSSAGKIKHLLRLCFTDIQVFIISVFEQRGWVGNITTIKEKHLLNEVFNGNNNASRFT